jgi:maleylacetoacetate isomerase
MTSEIALYSFFRSSAAWRVRIALALKGLEYETIPINLRGGEHRESPYNDVNPGLLVPTLTVNGHTLAQSLAIVEYLDEVYPDTPQLVFGDPARRAQIRAFALQIACEIHPLNNLRVLKFLRTRLGQPEETVHGEWYRHWVLEGLDVLEQMVEGPRYCFGDQVSLADATLVPQIANATRFHIDLDQHPKLRSIVSHLESLDAFQAAAPERQPDRSRYEPS